MEELLTFIQSKPHTQELLRALAVKLALSNYPYHHISDILAVSQPFISKWKRIFETHGVAGLKRGYKGSTGYLDATQKVAVIAWLHEKDHWNLQELIEYIDAQYGVHFKSKQSYYNLFHAAHISWKKTQKTNPKRDDAHVEAKKKRLPATSRTVQMSVQTM